MEQAVSVDNSNKELDLIKRARDGDRRAFEELFKAHSPKVFSIAFRIAGNASDAEDICQEVFIQVIRKIDSFQGKSSFSTWLYRITVNRSRDCLRKKKRSHESLAREDDAQAISEKTGGGDASSGPEIKIIEREKQERIQQALSELPVSLRIPLVLHELEDLQYGEISQLLKVPLGTVKSRIFRARIKLAEIIGRGDEQNE